MRVSIIVPVLNRERLILRCLDSIGAQTMLPAEIIVVDNGSDDNTLEVVNKWKEDFYLHCDKEASKVDIKILEEPERGVCAARQRGLEESTGDLLYFFDSDDAMDKNLIAKAYEEFCSKEEPDLVCWQCRIHLLDGKVKVPHFQWHNAMESHLIDTLLRTQGYMIKRNFLLKAGGWNKRLPVWNDMELGARILLNHPSIKGIPRILADIYSQKQSITGTAFSLREGEWEYSLDMIRKDAAEAGHPSQHKIEKIITYREIVLAATYHREGNRNGADILKGKALHRLRWKDAVLMHLVYQYTRLGGRGAWRIVRNFYL